MMTVEEMIAEAEKYLPYSAFGEKGQAAAAQAWLMRADLELRLQERRSLFAADAVKKIDASFQLYSSYSPPHVVPLASGDGFLIHLSEYDPRGRSPRDDHPWGEVITWAVNVTKTYAEAGWKIRFKLGDAKPCRGEHQFYYALNPYTDENPSGTTIERQVPCCCKCGAPRPVV